jgi:hypothetical protein
MITINDAWDEGNFNNVYPKFTEPTQAEMNENVAKFHKNLKPVLSQAQLKAKRAEAEELAPDYFRGA